MAVDGVFHLELLILGAQLGFPVQEGDDKLAARLEHPMDLPESCLRIGEEAVHCHHQSQVIGRIFQRKRLSLALHEPDTPALCPGTHIRRRVHACADAEPGRENSGSHADFHAIVKLRHHLTDGLCLRLQQQRVLIEPAVISGCFSLKNIHGTASFPLYNSVFRVTIPPAAVKSKSSVSCSR